MIHQRHIIMVFEHVKDVKVFLKYILNEINNFHFLNLFTKKKTKPT